MSFLKKYLLWILLIGSIIFWGYVHFLEKNPCEVPISYSIGTFDARFGISKSDFISAIEAASHAWETSIGKNLFAYTSDQKSDLSINLIYDDRQRLSDQNRDLVSDVNETKQTADEVKQQFLDLQNRYQNAAAEYESMLSAYKKRKGSFDALEAKRQEVNSLANQINALVNKYNFLVRSANATIKVINQYAGQEFEEGQYILDEKGQRINIYEFGNRDILVRVLAHELGHSLGLDHNDNPQSIMYYLNSSKNIKPTVDDISELKAICGMK